MEPEISQITSDFAYGFNFTGSTVKPNFSAKSRNWKKRGDSKTYLPKASDLSALCSHTSLIKSHAAQWWPKQVHSHLVLEYVVAIGLLHLHIDAKTSKVRFCICRWLKPDILEEHTLKWPIYFRLIVLYFDLNVFIMITHKPSWPQN